MEEQIRIRLARLRQDATAAPHEAANNSSDIVCGACAILKKKIAKPSDHREIDFVDSSEFQKGSVISLRAVPSLLLLPHVPALTVPGPRPA